MPNCQGILKNGANCRHQARAGRHTCGKHAAQEPIVIAPYVPVCGRRMGNGEACTRDRAPGQTLCRMHHRAAERQRDRAAIADIRFAILHLVWNTNNPNAARQAIMVAIAQGRVSARGGQQLTNFLYHEELLWTNMHAPPPGIQPRTELQRLALDAQNVHTGAVAKQTNAAMDLLLTTVVPLEQKTLREIQSAWCEKAPVRFRRVVKDMSTWYGIAMCRDQGDQLYKRVLDGLWATIRKSPFKTDLTQRLWEEAEESLGMCCEGHLSRLCNVLVGYDDAFKPQVSLGEMLQQRMSAIAAEDVDTLLKVERAWFAMEEMGVPMEERTAWIEAM